MADKSALQEALSGVVPDVGFLLDSRTVLTRLKAIEEYARCVPYVPDDPAHRETGLSWSDFLFMGGNTPERLAALYDSPSTADGNLLPHQAFLLAILALLETPSAFINYFSGAHRNLYYRQLLSLQEKAAEPSQVAVSIELNSDTPEKMLSAGTLLDAGQDSQGRVIEFRLDDELLANHSKWTDLRWCYPSVKGVGAGTSAIVYDEQYVWPSNGMNLFEAVEQDQLILTGRMLASPLLVNDSSQDLVVSVMFATSPAKAGLLAHASSGEEWLPLKITDSADRSLSFTLPADSGGISIPDGLAGVAFTIPVIRLSRQDGQSVPDIVSVTVNGIDLTSDQYQTAIMTPFGHSDEVQAVENMQLYIGISGMLPEQTLSLFWKLNTAQPLTLNWQYLTKNNRWKELDPYLIDRTHRLLRSERWTTILPADAGNMAPAMPSGRHWFRAEIVPISTQELGVAKYPRLVGLITNGMTATLNNLPMLDSTVAGTSFPAGAIRQFVKNIPGVARIQQPWVSWGGSPPESQDAYGIRVAQRLFHRHRALTWPDMMMLLETTFPVVFGVMQPSGDILTTVPALTEQTLVVIPRVTAKDNSDPLRPVFNAARLELMSNTLQSLASLWQNIQVRNPRYRDVQLEYDVKFYTGVNPMWAERELQNALIARYMPWSTGMTAGVSLANRLNYYDVMATLQQQPYVDHVIGLKLDGMEDSIQGDGDEVLILCWPN
ncbi:hypothetical protein [Enterobacter roggenkampii]|uniref:hypothetical protein n=1 Tax=Enterobacter roggenkampii TaxID=1812935 RepID=UPI00084C8DFA|nr:hypothetical protein [Enterobacter roggenkampii]AOP98023.1 hypothetical protein BFV67_22895 [Enterobacter roggenkampii]QWZ75376.1 hypothetical protein I6L60_23060 [Enterobacter roggenkampii]